MLLKKEVLLPIVLIGVFNLGGNINYYAFNYAISGIGYSYSVEIVLFGLVEFIGVFPMSTFIRYLVFLGSKTPRKAGLIGLIVMEIAISLLFIVNLSRMTETVLVVLVRFMLGIHFPIKSTSTCSTFTSWSRHSRSTSRPPLSASSSSSDRWAN